MFFLFASLEVSNGKLIYLPPQLGISNVITIFSAISIPSSISFRSVE